MGTALKSKVSKVLPAGNRALARCRSIRRRPRSATSCSASAARKRAAGQPSLSARAARAAHISLMAGKRNSLNKSSTREQLIAVDQIGQRHRVLAQRVDHVPVVDDMTALAVRDGPPPSERHHWRRAKKTFESVVIEVHAQAMADQARWGGVGNTAQNEAAARRYRDDLLLVIGGATLRQR